MQYKSSVVCAQCAAIHTPGECLVRVCVSIKSAARSGSKVVVQHCVKLQLHSYLETQTCGGTHQDDALQHVELLVNGSVSINGESQALVQEDTHRDDALQHVERLVNGCVSIEAAARPGGKLVMQHRLQPL